MSSKHIFPITDQENYIHHWDYSLIGIVSGPDTTNLLLVGLVLHCLGGSDSNIGAALVVGAIIIDLAFFVLSTSTFPFISLWNNTLGVATGIYSGDPYLIWRALVTLLFTAAVIAACVYMAPTLIAGFAGLGVSAALATAAGVLATMAIGNLVISAEAMVRSLLGPIDEGYFASGADTDQKTTIKSSAYSLDTNQTATYSHLPEKKDSDRPPSYQQATNPSSQA